MRNKFSYEERLKKMKASVKLNKNLLSEQLLPDDVTYLGSTEIIKMAEEEIDPLSQQEKKNEQ